MEPCADDFDFDDFRLFELPLDPLLLDPLLLDRDLETFFVAILASGD